MIERKVFFLAPRQLARNHSHAEEVATGHLADQLARPLRDLRISVTDRCNFRCVYCMPKQVFNKDHVYLSQQALLSFDEIARLATLFVAHGVEKIRLTGGEPLLRKGIEKLVAKLRDIHTPSGRPLDLTLTTNGSLLAAKAMALKDAGLDRVTVSLDALDDAIFKRMNDVDFSVVDVLHGLNAAQRAGLGPIKVNMVVKRGVNDCQIVPMAKHFKGSPYVLRFIEFMDVGSSNRWNLDEVVPSHEVIKQISAHLPVAPVDANYLGETAARWRYADGTGEIGVISSVTHAFCEDCTRLRLSTEGRMYTCLFASDGMDLKTMLRSGASDQALSTAIARHWRARKDRYSALRGTHDATLSGIGAKVEMSYIGG